MAAFPHNFLWGAATAAYQVEEDTTPTVKDRQSGISTLICRVPPLKAPPAILPSTTITVFAKTWR